MAALGIWLGGYWHPIARTSVAGRFGCDQCIGGCGKHPAEGATVHSTSYGDVVCDQCVRIDVREVLGDLTVTLDGKPAAISGSKLPFAQVAALDGSTGSIEWSWSAVQSIVAKGGAFKTGAST